MPRVIGVKMKIGLINSYVTLNKKSYDDDGVNW